MNTTLRHLEYLLSRHDCVIVPGLGAVLANWQSAEIDDENRCVAAPCRRYTFNGAMVESDGLIEASIQRSLGLDAAQAAQVVSDDVAAMVSELDGTGQVQLGRAGSLHKDSLTGAVIFVPRPDDILTPMIQWLPAKVSMVADIAEAQADTKERVAQELAPRRWKRFLRVAASVAAIVAVGVVASTPIVVDDANYASTALPPVSGPNYAYVPGQLPVLNLPMPGPEPIAVDTAARAAYQRSMLADTLETAQVAEVKTAPAVAKAAKPAVTVSDADQYCVVVASLASDADAHKFISQMRGKYDGALRIMNEGRYYRVYAATAASKAQAQDRLNQLADTFKGAWICRR